MTDEATGSNTATPILDQVPIWTDPARTVAYYKGRVALYAILEAMGIGPGDEVLIPGFTCFVVPAAVMYRGATPVYYDIDLATLNGSPRRASEQITQRTRAILIQHTFGRPADYKAFRQIANQHRLPIIEDCAHSMSVPTPDGPTGTLGDAAFTSLQWSKSVTTGLGGIARANVSNMASTLQRNAADYRAPSNRERITLGILAKLANLLLRPNLYWPAQSAYRTLARYGVVPGSST